MSRDPDNQELSDEIKREDGLERYWLFYNGEWAETICGLTSAIGVVLSCFLYVLGFGQTIFGYVSMGVAIIGFIGWYFVFKTMQQREGSGWRRQSRDSSATDRRKHMWLQAFGPLSFYFSEQLS